MIVQKDGAGKNCCPKPAITLTIRVNECNRDFTTHYPFRSVARDSFGVRRQAGDGEPKVVVRSNL
jgi:hypothetical protein